MVFLPGMLYTAAMAALCLRPPRRLPAWALAALVGGPLLFVLGLYLFPTPLWPGLGPLPLVCAGWAVLVGLLTGAALYCGRHLAQRALFYQQLAHTDPLTLLPNRHSLYARIAQLDGRQSLCVASLDLNGLKEINDAQGHMAGDALLVRTAQVLGRCGNRFTAYRTGGDEFVLLGAGVSEEDARDAMQALEAELAGSQVGAALGWAWAPAVTSADLPVLLRHSDERMYARKPPHFR